MKKVVFAFVLTICLGSSKLYSADFAFGYSGSVADSVGFMIIEEAYKDLDKSICAVQAPLARSLQLSTSGVTDGELMRLSGISMALDYNGLVKIDVPIFEITLHVLTLKENSQNVKQKNNPKIAGIKGAIFTPERNFTNQVVPANDFQSALGMVNKERVEGMFISNEIAAVIMRQFPNKYDSFQVSESRHVFHWLHEKHADFLPKVTRQLRKMKKNRRFDYYKALLQSKPNIDFSGAITFCEDAESLTSMIEQTK